MNLRIPTDDLHLEKIEKNLTIAEIKAMFSLSTETPTLVNKLRQNGVRPTMQMTRPTVYQTQWMTTLRLQEILAYRPPKAQDSIEERGWLDAYNRNRSVIWITNSSSSWANGMRRNRQWVLIKNI